MQRIGLYPGTFDPLTFGHMDIIELSAIDQFMVKLKIENQQQFDCLVLSTKEGITLKQGGDLMRKLGIAEGTLNNITSLQDATVVYPELRRAKEKSIILYELSKEAEVSGIKVATYNPFVTMKQALLSVFKNPKKVYLQYFRQCKL